MKTSTLTLALAATAAAQNATNGTLLSTLAGIPELSNLTTFFQPYQAALAGRTNITLLAPNNDAFTKFLNSSTGAALGSDAALISAILDYHILNGTHANFTNTSFVATSLGMGAYANVTGGQRVEALGGSNVTFLSGLLQNASVVNSTNFTGGVIHIIDSFLTLPQNISTSAVALNLTSAVGALKALNLSDTVDTTPDVTVFVPNNDAFQAVGGNLANMSTADLTAILEYHVIAGSVLYSTDLMNDTSVATLGGKNLTVYLEGSNVYVDSAKVVFPNVLVRNGVVHVIDRVLNPSNTTATPNTATTEQAFAGATSGSDVPFTSGVATPTSAVDTAAVASQASSATSSGGAFRPIETGAIGMAALFGGAAAVMNM